MRYGRTTTPTTGTSTFSSNQGSLPNQVRRTCNPTTIRKSEQWDTETCFLDSDVPFDRLTHRTSDMRLSFVRSQVEGRVKSVNYGQKLSKRVFREWRAG